MSAKTLQNIRKELKASGFDTNYVTDEQLRDVLMGASRGSTSLVEKKVENNEYLDQIDESGYSEYPNDSEVDSGHEFNDYDSNDDDADSLIMQFEVDDSGPVSSKEGAYSAWYLGDQVEVECTPPAQNVYPSSTGFDRHAALNKISPPSGKKIAVVVRDGGMEKQSKQVNGVRRAIFEEEENPEKSSKFAGGARRVPVHSSSRNQQERDRSAAASPSPVDAEAALGLIENSQLRSPGSQKHHKNGNALDLATLEHSLQDLRVAGLGLGIGRHHSASMDSYSEDEELAQINVRGALDYFEEEQQQNEAYEESNHQLSEEAGHKTGNINFEVETYQSENVGLDFAGNEELLNEDLRIHRDDCEEGNISVIARSARSKQSAAPLHRVNHGSFMVKSPVPLTNNRSSGRVDPVARYHQLQREWKKIRLSSSGEKCVEVYGSPFTPLGTSVESVGVGKPSSSSSSSSLSKKKVAKGKKKSKPLSRSSSAKKKIGNKFKPPHTQKRTAVRDEVREQHMRSAAVEGPEALRAERRRQRERKEKRERRKRQNFVVPTAKRRDNLRWEMRAKMLSLPRV